MSSDTDSSIWGNAAFVRMWTAATVSIFGSLITRLALPYVAILVLGAGPLEVTGLRSAEIVAGLTFGLLAGAWVDRLRRRPVLVAADFGRAILLGSIPVAALAGWLSMVQLLVVAFGAAILTAFFDSADSAYLPTVLERPRLVAANAALAASSSAAEVTAFGLAGLLIAAFTAPIVIGIDALSFLVSGLLLGSIRRPEPAPPPSEGREPILAEIRTGFRFLARDPIVRSLAIARVIGGFSNGVFGGLWLLFVSQGLGLGPIAVGLIAAVGGAAALGGASLVRLLTRRWSIGLILVASLGLSAAASLAIPLAPSAVPLVAAGFLVFAQLFGDSTATIFEILEASVRQTRVGEQGLGRVSASIRTVALLTELLGAVSAGIVAETLGLRVAIALAPIAGLIAAWYLWHGPITRLREPIQPIGELS
jgi:predicted MFS family arabinose efflux permease